MFPYLFIYLFTPVINEINIFRKYMLQCWPMVVCRHWEHYGKDLQELVHIVQYNNTSQSS